MARVVGHDYSTTGSSLCFYNSPPSSTAHCLHDGRPSSFFWGRSRLCAHHLHWKYARIPLPPNVTRADEFGLRPHALRRSNHTHSLCFLFEVLRVQTCKPDGSSPTGDVQYVESSHSDAICYLLLLLLPLLLRLLLLLPLSLLLLRPPLSLLLLIATTIITTYALQNGSSPSHRFLVFLRSVPHFPLVPPMLMTKLAHTELVKVGEGVACPSNFSNISQFLPNKKRPY